MRCVLILGRIECAVFVRPTFFFGWSDCASPTISTSIMLQARAEEACKILLVCTRNVAYLVLCYPYVSYEYGLRPCPVLQLGSYYVRYSHLPGIVTRTRSGEGRLSIRPLKVQPGKAYFAALHSKIQNCDASQLWRNTLTKGLSLLPPRMACTNA